MLLAELLMAYSLIHLHGPGAQVIEVNPYEVSSLREPQENSDGHFAQGTRCLVTMSNGKINAVVEMCEDVARKIQEATSGNK